MKPPSPLFADTYDLTAWLLGHFDGASGVLAHAVCTEALGLLRAVTLALKGRERMDQLDEADERLIALRVQIRLAGTLEALSERQMLHALERADGIGRQIGGWLRSLGPA